MTENQKTLTVIGVIILAALAIWWLVTNANVTASATPDAAATQAAALPGLTLPTSGGDVYNIGGNSGGGSNSSPVLSAAPPPSLIPTSASASNPTPTNCGCGGGPGVNYGSPVNQITELASYVPPSAPLPPGPTPIQYSPAPMQTSWTDNAGFNMSYTPFGGWSLQGPFD